MSVSTNPSNYPDSLLDPCWKDNYVAREVNVKTASSPNVQGWSGCVESDMKVGAKCFSGDYVGNKRSYGSAREFVTLTQSVKNQSRFVAVFLDRDGVINRALERDGFPYAPTSLNEFQIYPEVPDACAKLKAAGFLLVVATNQPDVGRGTMKQEVVESIHAEMCRQLPFDRVEVCYHPGYSDSECDCRKPRPGMLLCAADELGIDLAQSWMVGDRWRDIDCGHAAGCRTVLIDRHYAEALKQPPDFRVENLLEAAEIILTGGE